MVADLSGELALVFEPRMTGLVLVADPPNETHLRLRIQLADCPAKQLLYWDRRGLGSVKCYTADELKERYAAGNLGPDALEISWSELKRRLEKSRREIKVALLDQRVVAGIGNLYAAEILHLSRIHPAQRCCDLSGPQWKRMQAAIRAVLLEAIRYEGSTLSDGTYRNALNQSGAYQNEHRVYDRAGQVCSTCHKGEIIRTVQAQRATFYCPRCQRLRKMLVTPRAT